MTHKISIFFFLLIVAGAGVYYLVQDPAEKNEQSPEVYADTLPAPAQPSIKARKDTMPPTPPPVGEEFAPGTAMIRATILSVDYTGDQPDSMTVKVDEVMGYGSATPPIATETELSFGILNFLKNNSEYKSLIQEKAEIKMVINSQQQMKIKGADQGQSWALVEIKQ